MSAETSPSAHPALPVRILAGLGSAAPLPPVATRRRLLFLASLSVGAFVAVLAQGRIPQSPEYHRFADERLFLGIPRFGDVVTNFPFLLVGVLGLVFLLRRGKTGPDAGFELAGERTAYFTLFVGMVLTAFGSAYYHWAPDSPRLVWDRLPVTLVFMSLFDIVIAERIGARLGARLLAPLLVVGLGSVVYWAVSEDRGAGDLRLYAFVQFFPMLAIPLILLLFPPRYTHGHHFWRVLGWYALAKVCEALDRPIFAWNGIASGHNLKHCLAAFATWWVLRTLTHRRPLGGGQGAEAVAVRP